MRSFFAGAFAAFSLFAVAVGAHAQTPAPAAPTVTISAARTPSSTPPDSATSAALPKARTWLVENHDRLVSVHEKDGAPLFAQVIPTSDVVIDVDIPNSSKKDLVMTLKDANGKRIYSMTFPHTEHGKLEFAAISDEHIGDDGTPPVKTGGTSFTITPTAADPNDKSEKQGGKLHLVLGNDNLLVSGNVVFEDGRIVMERHGTRIIASYFEKGKKTSEQVIDLNIDVAKGVGALALNGKEVGSFKSGGESGTLRLHDEKGEVTSRVVNQDGKDYTEFMVGDRKILVEGTHWSIALKDGVMTLTPSANTATPAPATPAAPITTTADK